MTPYVSYDYRATVVRWVDGDTVWLDVDLGFAMTARLDFRLLHIDTPERGKFGFEEAKTFVNETAPVGTELIIRTRKDPDKYGRFLAELFIGDWVSLNKLLLEYGHALEYAGEAR